MNENPMMVKAAWIGIDDINLFEINEAFSSPFTYQSHKLELDPENKPDLNFSNKIDGFLGHLDSVSKGENNLTHDVIIVMQASIFEEGDGNTRDMLLLNVTLLSLGIEDERVHYRKLSASVLESVVYANFP
jgi:hypothetical protein